MKLAVRAKALGKKLTLMTTAFVLAVSSLTALTPFVLADKASAVGSSVNTVTASDVTSNSMTLNFNIVSNSLPGATGIFETQVDSNPVAEYMFPLGTTQAPFTGVSSFVQVRETIVTNEWSEEWTDWKKFYVTPQDTTAPTTTVSTGEVSLPSNAYTDPTVYVPASAATTFQAQLTDDMSGPQGAYIELFKANWNGTYGTWVKDNTSGAGNVRYGASPKLVYNTSALSGKYGLKVVARDNDGNSKTTFHFFTIDRDIPTVSIKSGTSTVEGSSATNPYTWISFKLHDVSGNLKEVSLNGHTYNRSGTWNDLNWSNINPAHILQGLNTITVRDKAGNESSLTFNYDTIAPVATITSPADGAVLRGIVSVSGTVTDDNPMNTHFKVTGPNGYKKESTYKDGRTTHSFNWDTTALTEGVYTIQFETRDKAGNKTAVSVTSIDVTVDNTAPQLAVDAPVDLVTYGNSLTVTGSVFDDNLKEYKYQILDENKQNTLGSIGWSRLGGTSNATGDLFTADISNLANGTYYISVWATDKAGNATNTSGNRFEAPYIMKFTVDRAVNVSIDTIATNTATPTIQGQMTRNADGSSVANTDVVVTVDGTSYTTTTDVDGKWSVTPTVGVGAHTVTVALAGGASLASTSFTTVFVPVDVDEEEEEETANPAGANPLQTPAAATPLIVNPAGQAALGANDNADDNGTPAVEGTSTEKNLAAAVNNTDGSAFGLAWYWWLLIVAGLATILWWIIAAARRRQEEN